MTELAFAIFNGLAAGMAAFLVAAGVTLIFGVLKILNFSHGAFFMLGAYVAFSLIGASTYSVPVLIGASLVSGAVIGLCGYLTDRIVLRRLRDFDEHYVLIATFALLLVVTGFTKLIWGLDYHSVNLPSSLAGAVKIFGVTIPTYLLFVIVVGLVVFVLLDTLLHRMWIGKLLQGVVNDSWILGVMGYNIPILYAGTVVLSFVLAGFAGGILLPNQSLSPALGDTYILLGFVTVIIGGLGNVRGAFAAALLMGLIESVSTVTFSNYPGLASYVAIVVMLLLRPQGLFGTTPDNIAVEKWSSLFRLRRPPAPPRPAIKVRAQTLSATALAAVDIGFKPRGGIVLPIMGIIAVAAVVMAPYWANSGLLFIIGLTLIEALFALSWYFLFAGAGVVSFGHAAFFGIGSYLVGFLLKSAPDLSILLLLAGAGVLGALVAWLVGLVALKRSSGIYLAILTMSLAEICRMLIGYSTALGRDDGLSAIPRPVLTLPWLKISLATDLAYYWFLSAVVMALTGVVWWVAHSRFGRALRCIEQDPERASFIGIDVARNRLWAFVFSGGLAAIAGGLMPSWTQIVTPELTNLFHSTQPILNSLLGGVHSFWGPLVGSSAFAAVNYFTRNLAGLSEIVVGVTLLVVVLGAPNGLVGLFIKVERRLQKLWSIETTPAPAETPEKPA